MAESTEEGLKRVLGVPGLAINVINMTIGAGIFALPAIVSMQMGAAGISAYMFCGFMMASIMLCYAEVGTRINTSGGSYAYVEAAFGPLAGFIINGIFLIGWGTVSDAAVLNISADALGDLLPVFKQPLARGLLFLSLMSFFALLNVRGAKQGARFVTLLTVIKVLPLLGILIFGFSHIKAANLSWQQNPSLQSLGNTAIVLFFAFAGFETPLNASGEIKNPKRTIPLALLFAGVLLLIIYISLQTVVQGILGAEVSAFKDAPLAELARRLIGPAGGIILLLATIISCWGGISGDVLATPRLLFAGARDGLFPKFLAKIHPRFATPYWAIFVFAALGFIFSISGGFKQLAMLASGSLLLIYLAVVLAMIKLRLTNKKADTEAFKVPGGLIIPLLAIATIVWLLFQLSRGEFISILIFIALLSIIYVVTKKLKKI